MEFGRSGNSKDLTMRFEDVPIVLVDDDDDDIFLLTEALRELGYTNRLIPFTSSVDFLKYFEKDSDSHVPAITIMDWNMPLLNGLDLLTRINKDYPHRKIFITILSTSRRESDRETAMHLGAYEYYVKPTNLEGLSTFWQHIIERAKKSGLYPF